jgi:hypothetical protein
VGIQLVDFTAYEGNKEFENQVTHNNGEWVFVDLKIRGKIINVHKV